ncbi:MAG TPA: DUF6265 family protein [Phenylobacterium sp.]|jgi:hypothetical protein
MILAAMIAAAVSTAAPADVGKLAWIAGAWSETKNGVTTRETWLSPLGGAMSGATQTNRPGKPASSEFSVIAIQPDGRIAFIPFIKEDAPTPFALQPGPEGEAVFERVSDDFPKRVIYRKCGRDLCARIEGVVKGKLQGKEWRYTKVAP